MIELNGINPAGMPQPIEPTGSVRPAKTPAHLPAHDVVEISTAARLAAKIQEVPGVRTELVAQVKAQIEADTYVTPERIEGAINGLMADLLG